MSACGRSLPGSEAQPQPDRRRGPQAARGLGWQREGGSSKRWLCHVFASLAVRLYQVIVASLAVARVLRQKMVSREGIEPST